MTHAEVLDALTNVFRDIFDDNSIVINDQTTANDIEDWDSLEHINLIEAVEKEFNMRFQMREVSGMKMSEKWWTLSLPVQSRKRKNVVSSVKLQPIAAAPPAFA